MIKVLLPKDRYEINLTACHWMSCWLRRRGKARETLLGSGFMVAAIKINRVHIHFKKAEYSLCVFCHIRGIWRHELNVLDKPDRLR